MAETKPAAMRPEDVPGELVDDAVDVWHETPHLLLDDRMRAILAAVLPARDAMIRADERRRCRQQDRINRLLDRYNEAKSYSTFAEIARGEQP